MDGTTDTPVQDQPPKKLSVDDFAAKIKAKYPEYAGVDNTVLTQRILTKYPDYSDKVDMPKKAGGAGSPHDFGMGYKPTPEDLKTKQDWKDFQNGLEKSPNGSKPSQGTEPVPGLQNYWNSLHPDEQKALSDKNKQSQQQHGEESISATPAQQEAEYRYSQTPVGKIDNSIKYLAQKATKGGLQVLKGAAYLARLGTSSDPSTFFTESHTINKAEEKADKATDFMSKGDQSRVEDSKAIANLGGLAEFLPAAAAAEGTGGASLYLQGMGSGKETMDQAEKNGAKINPVVKNAFILGSGAVNGFLMDEAGSTIFKSLGTSLKNDVVAEITTNAIKEAAGKELTAEGFNDLLKQGAKTWQDKTLQAGVNYLENTKHAITNLAALNVADFALKKGVDVASDKPVFNETPGDLADQLGNTIKTGAAFGAAGSLGDASKLTPFSQYKNAVMDNLLHDSSDDNIAKTKQFIDQHGTEQGWTPEEIKATNDHVDEIAKVTKTLPKELPVDKAEKAAELVIGRNNLQKQLTDLQEQRKSVDPAMQDVISPQEQLLTDKVEQANDKLKDIATGSKTTYSRGTGDNDDLFFKTTKGKREEISESRYKLERAERDASAAQNSDGATQPLSNEPPQDAPGEPEAVGSVDNEETTNNQIINQSDNESKNDDSQKGEEGQSQANAEEGNEKNGQDEKNGLKVTSGEAKTEPETTFKVGDDYKLANETGKVIRVKELPSGDTELKVKKADDTSETVVIPNSDNKTKVTNLSEIELSRKKELLKNIKNKFFREDELSSPTEKEGDEDGVYGLDHEREKASDNLRRAQNGLYNVNRNKEIYENMLVTGKPKWHYKSILKEGKSIEDILKEYPKHIKNAEKALKSAKKAVSDLDPSKRGVEFVSKKITEGVKKGTISKESAELSNKLLENNPELFKDLAIYITAKKDIFASGSYRGKDALITLFKDNNKTTAVHEILHHTERFLPTEIRNGILNEWGNGLHKELASLQEKIDNTTDSETINKLSKAIRYLNLADKMQSEADYQKKSEIRNELKDIFRSRIVPHKYYEFFSPSEWWAVNAAEKFSKSDSIGNSWISKAKSWYNELITAAKNVLGLNRTQQVERGLQQILSGNPLKEQKDKFLEHLGKGDDLLSDSGDDLLSDSEVKEYARLAFKDTNGDFKAFSKDLMDNIGEGIKEHIPVLFKELSSENKEKPRYSIKGEKITKLPIAEHVELNNILKSDHGITIQDLKDEHEERNAGGNQTQEATTNAETVQQPENDGTGNAGENRSGESPEGGKGGKSKTTFKKPTKSILTADEATRRLELRKKFGGTFRTSVPGKELFDKEFYEYAGLIFKEAKGEFKEFAKTLIDEVGDKIKDHLPHLWQKVGGNVADIPKEEEKAVYGTKNAITEDLQDGLGLPPIEIPKDRSDDESLAAWKNGKRTPQEIIDQLLSTETDIYDKAITPNDEPIMREYIRQLGERGRELTKIKLHLQERADTGAPGADMDLASVTQQINQHLDEYNNALNASKVGGNIWHKYGDERQKAIDDKGLILNAIDRINNIYGKNIPADIKQQLKDLQTKHDELTAKNEELQRKIKEDKAKDVFEKSKPKRTILGTKKLSDDEFRLAKTDILTDLKNDWKKSFAKTYATLPGVPQFNAIAPHIAKLLKLYADRGISKFDDVVKGIHSDIKDDLNGITENDIKDIIAGRYSNQRPLSDLQKQVNELRVQARNKIKIAELENGIIAKTKSKGESSPEVKDIQKQVAELKKKALNQYANLSAEELKKQSASIQKKIDKGEFFKEPVVKRKWETDPEWIKNNKEKANLVFKLRKMEREALDSKKSKFMRGLDWTNRWGRRVIFFGANAVYTKLSSAAVLGSFVHRLPEQTLGIINAKMFPNIARTAPIEGVTNMAAEGQWYLDFVNPKEFAIDVKDIVLTGETRLSKEMDTHAAGTHIPIIDLFAADGHQILKSTVKRATFNAAFRYQMDWYASNGTDNTHPMIIESARQAAWQRANYEVFQDNPKNQTKIKEYFNQLERSGILNRNKPDGWSKMQGNAQYSAAALYHFFIPINTVPVNILKRIGLGITLPKTYLEAISKNKSVREGILKMTAEESDAILLQLKKGQIGAAYWTLGFVLGGTMAGGLYTNMYPNKEREKDAVTPDADYLNLLGVDVPKDVQHNTQFQALQMGATWGMVRDHYVDDKGESQLMAIFAATAATAGVAAKEHPVASTVLNIGDALTTPHGNTKWVQDLRRRIGVQKAQDIFGLMGYDIGNDAEYYNTKGKMKKVGQ